MQGGGGPLGRMNAPSSFPAPGIPGAPATPAAQPAAGATPPNPFNMFAGLGGAGAGAGTGTGAGTGAGANPMNPFGMDPATMQQILGMGNAFGGPNAFGGGFGGAPAAPADTRSPEERFQVQLQQLQDMGFTNASQNVRALLATGGNVHSAIEYILGGGGL